MWSFGLSIQRMAIGFGFEKRLGTREYHRIRCYLAERWSKKHEKTIITWGDFLQKFLSSTALRLAITKAKVNPSFVRLAACEKSLLPGVSDAHRHPSFVFQIYPSLEMPCPLSYAHRFFYCGISAILVNKVFPAWSWRCMWVVRMWISEAWKEVAGTEADW